MYTGAKERFRWQILSSCSPLNFIELLTNFSVLAIIPYIFSNAVAFLTTLITLQDFRNIFTHLLFTLVQHILEIQNIGAEKKMATK